MDFSKTRIKDIRVHGSLSEKQLDKSH